VLADKSRKKRTRNTKIGRNVDRRLPTPIDNNAYQFPGQKSKVKVTRSTNVETKSVSPTKFKLGIGGWCMRYHLPWPAIKACEVGLLHAGGDIPCRPHQLAVATQLVIYALKSLRIL